MQHKQNHIKNNTDVLGEIYHYLSDEKETHNFSLVNRAWNKTHKNEQPTFLLRKKLKQALEAKDSGWIKGVIKLIWKAGLCKKIVNHSLVATVKSYSDKEEELPIVGVLLNGNRIFQDIIYFDIAKYLIKQGAIVPQPRKKQSDFETTSDYLWHLAHSEYDLFLALLNNPKVLQMRGENKETILHHAARIGLIEGTNSSSLILSQLFNAESLNLTIQDVNGDTPVHIAAKYCEDRVTCRYVFPYFVSEASKRNFNFDTLNNNGQAVVHIASRIERMNLVASLIDEASTINLDILSSSGTSALYYSINWMNIGAAHTLLDSGASVDAYGKKEENPISMLNSYINSFTKHISLIQAADSKELSQFCKNNKDFIMELTGMTDSKESKSINNQLYNKAENLAQQTKGNLPAYKKVLQELIYLKKRMIKMTCSQMIQKEIEALFSDIVEPQTSQQAVAYAKHMAIIKDAEFNALLPNLRAKTLEIIRGKFNPDSIEDNINYSALIDDMLDVSMSPSSFLQEKLLNSAGYKHYCMSVLRQNYNFFKELGKDAPAPLEIKSAAYNAPKNLDQQFS